VRGDSRLDLYAKSLAVLLLGSLGLAGAVIDRWPGSADLPVTPPPSIISLNPIVQTAFDLPGLTEPWAERIAAAEVRPARASVVPAVAERRPASQTPDAVIGSAGLTVSGLTESISAALPHVELIALPAVPPTEVPAISTLASADPYRPLVPSLGSGALDQSEDGFFSGVLKKTGSSVSTSLGKASNSLVGAVHVVGDAVRKVF
jgi:hypothetical protein